MSSSDRQLSNAQDLSTTVDESNSSVGHQAERSHLHDIVPAATTSSSSPRRFEELHDGFRTPTNTIPLTTECPPAPRKPKSHKRTITSLLREDNELYCGDEYQQIDLVIEVDMWLNFMEDKDRKRIKKARRQSGKSTSS